MDYGGLVKRAIDIMWKFKYLWLFGLFLEFGAGGGGGAGRVPDKFKVSITDFFGSISLSVVILLILVGLVVFLLYLILSIISQGGLIHCVSKIEKGENPALRDGWNMGVKNFWRILGIGILILILVLGSMAITFGPFVILLIVSKTLGLLSLIIFIPLFLVLLIPIALIELYANRVCIIEGKGIFDSIAGGWEMLKSNLGKSLVLALIGIISTIVYIIGFLIVGLILAIPFIVLGAINLFWGIALGVLVGLIYLAITSGIWGAFIDSLWTLAYLEMKKLKPAEVGVHT
ncbi:MAG: hypothetical protein MUO91_07600 [candidate division Zixibacteria bacterium]|nr:hypothetical protein [candidate division Zixibacteria bacterium]